MITGFNPAVSNNRNQRQNFKALPIDKITKNDAEAEMFRMAVSRGRVAKTDENVKDLFTAMDKAVNEKKLGVKSFLDDVAERWGVKK